MARRERAQWPRGRCREILRENYLLFFQIGHKGQMSQFCGQESWCDNFNSERAMMAAIRRVEEQYVVVGVTEMWEETLEVTMMMREIAMEIVMETLFR